jgi:hypothetical protein
MGFELINNVYCILNKIKTQWFNVPLDVYTLMQTSKSHEIGFEKMILLV